MNYSAGYLLVCFGGGIGSIPCHAAGFLGKALPGAFLWVEG